MTGRTNVAVAVGAALAMEPVAALSHRLVMHGRGWKWHRVHHRRRPSGVDANDLFPVVAAGATIATMGVAARTGRGRLMAIGAGVSAYGMAYLAVHDVCVHGRLRNGRPLIAGRWLEWIAASHARHHRTGKAPYGFLLPVSPRNPLMASGSVSRVPARYPQETERAA